MPLTTPATSLVNFTPSSTELVSPESTSPALSVTFDPQIEHGQAMFTEVPPGVSVLPLSSVARDSIVVDGLPCAVQVYDQVTLAAAGDMVVTGCQVLPPSVDTSTPATTPPPSVAVPETVTLAPSARFAPAEGEVMVE